MNAILFSSLSHTHMLRLCSHTKCDWRRKIYFIWYCRFANQPDFVETHKQPWATVHSHWQILLFWDMASPKEEMKKKRRKKEKKKRNTNTENRRQNGIITWKMQWRFCYGKKICHRTTEREKERWRPEWILMNCITAYDENDWRVYTQNTNYSLIARILKSR